ncbi:MAG: N-acetylmuramate alpha-1-phosphate uridylyltransferase MurU [Pseudomonadota bacterium]
MRAMILAAGRGERLRPLTDQVPKPLLYVGRRRLLDYQIFALKRAGVSEIVVNVCWLGERIIDTLAGGAHYGIPIKISDERDAILGTAGGIKNALPLLGEEPFIVCNADVLTDFDYTDLALDKNCLAKLVLVNNPSHNPAGDFALEDGLITQSENERLTFSGIGIYSPELFHSIENSPAQLAPVLRKLAAQNQLAGEHFNGLWLDVGTPERLEAARQIATQRELS